MEHNAPKPEPTIAQRILARHKARLAQEAEAARRKAHEEQQFKHQTARDTARFEDAAYHIETGVDPFNKRILLNVEQKEALLGILNASKSSHDSIIDAWAAFEDGAKEYMDEKLTIEMRERTYVETMRQLTGKDEIELGKYAIVPQQFSTQVGTSHKSAPHFPTDKTLELYTFWKSLGIKPSKTATSWVRPDHRMKVNRTIVSNHEYQLKSTGRIEGLFMDLLKDGDRFFKAIEEKHGIQVSSDDQKKFHTLITEAIESQQKELAAVNDRVR